MNAENLDENLPKPVYFGEQSASGIDISLLRSNLRLTPEERIKRHMRALKGTEVVRRAGRNAGLFKDRRVIE